MPPPLSIPCMYFTIIHTELGKIIYEPSVAIASKHAHAILYEHSNSYRFMHVYISNNVYHIVSTGVMQ